MLLHFLILKIESGKRDLMALRKPIENKVFFAGEADNRNHFGTVHGAWDSGKTVAATIVDLNL